MDPIPSRRMYSVEVLCRQKCSSEWRQLERAPNLKDKAALGGNPHHCPEVLAVRPFFHLSRYTTYNCNNRKTIAKVPFLVSNYLVIGN